jgi:ABC-type multidrug transport system fused ATPase/permease subunit
MLRHPPLVLCDEATAALDSESERKVQAALDAMLGAAAATAAEGSGSSGAASEARRATTSLVIAHRLSTIRDADVIYVMDRGAVVESGTHDQLMALAGGLYRSLALAQGILLQQEAQEGGEEGGEGTAAAAATATTSSAQQAGGPPAIDSTSV